MTIPDYPQRTVYSISGKTYITLSCGDMAGKMVFLLHVIGFLA